MFGHRFFGARFFGVRYWGPRLAVAGTHVTTGVLLGAGALLVGSAVHIFSATPHTSIGVLRGTNSQIVGAANHSSLHGGPSITQRSRFVLSTKQVANPMRIVFDFAAQLPWPEDLVSATNTVSVYSGDDPGPSLAFVGSPTFLGTQAIQMISGGVSGCIYRLVSRGLSDAGRQTFLNTFLVVL